MPTSWPCPGLFIREPDLANKLAAGRTGTVECVSCNMCLVHDGFDPLRCWRTSPAAVAAHVYTRHIRGRLAKSSGYAPESLTYPLGLSEKAAAGGDEAQPPRLERTVSEANRSGRRTAGLKPGFGLTPTRGP